MPDDAPGGHRLAGRWPTILTAFSAVLVLAAGYFSLAGQRESQAAIAWVQHTFIVLQETESLRAELFDAESNQRSYVLTGESAYLGHYRAAVSAVPAQVDRIRALTADNPEQQTRTTALGALANLRLAELAEVAEVRARSGLDAARQRVSVNVAKGTMAAFRAKLGEIQDKERGLLKERLARRDASVHAALVSTAALGGLSMLTFGAAVALLERTGRRRRDAEHRALEDRERLRVTLQSIGDGVIATNLEGTVVFLNPVAEALTGWRQLDATGLPIGQVFRIVNEFSRDEVESPVAKVLRQGLIVGLANHTVLIARDGSERPIDDSGAPIRGADGGLMGVVLVFRDVSARRAAEASRDRLLRAESARSAAETANRTKDDFLAMVSHELRAPLTAALSWIELHREGSLDRVQQTDALEIIDRNLRRQALLIDDLLDVSRIVAGKLSVERVPFDAAAVTRSAVEDARSSADARSVALVLRGDSEVRLALGDPTRFAQIVSNLLSNAIKFTPPEGRVEVETSASDGVVEIEVRDTGIGIAPDFLPHVFERFRQAPSGTARGTPGLGLGLSIARDLIEMQKGTITAHSEGIGLGARFRVSLSAANVRAGGVPWRASRASDATGLWGARVLLVEDHGDLRAALVQRLRRRGLTVRDVGSTSEALRALADERPDVLVSDIGLDGGSGLELIRALRASDSTADSRTPAIAVSGYAADQDRSDALRAGFDAYLPKPIDFDALLDAIVELRERASR